MDPQETTNPENASLQESDQNVAAEQLAQVIAPVQGVVQPLELEQSATMSPAPDLATEPVVVASPAAPAVKSNRFEELKRGSIVWLPLFLLFDAVIAGATFLCWSVPLIMFSLSVLWVSGTWTIVWNILYNLFQLAGFVIYLFAFLSVYKRKASAYKMTLISSYYAIALSMIMFIQGSSSILNLAFTVVIATIIVLSVKQYHRYFDPNVSGIKGLILGDIPPKKSVKTIVYASYVVVTVGLLFSILFSGLIMTLISGAAPSGAGIMRAPFSTQGTSSREDEEIESLDSSEKITESYVDICPEVADIKEFEDSLALRKVDNAFWSLVPKEFKGPLEGSFLGKCNFTLLPTNSRKQQLTINYYFYGGINGIGGISNFPEYAKKYALSTPERISDAILVSDLKKISENLYSRTWREDKVLPGIVTTYYIYSKQQDAMYQLSLTGSTYPDKNAILKEDYEEYSIITEKVLNSIKAI